MSNGRNMVHDIDNALGLRLHHADDRSRSSSRAGAGGNLPARLRLFNTTGRYRPCDTLRAVPPSRHWEHCSGYSLLAIAGPAFGAQRTFVRSSSDRERREYRVQLLAGCALPKLQLPRSRSPIPGGEVVILDTAGYGPMTINKSIKVIGPSGVYGGISVQGGANPTIGIVINAANSDDITLRGLDICGVPGSPRTPRSASTSSTPARSTSRNRRSGTSPTIGRLHPDRHWGHRARVRGRQHPARVRHGRACNWQHRLANSSSVIVDNTRIERGRNPTSTDSYGVSISNHLSLTLRNSVITRPTRRAHRLHAQRRRYPGRRRE